MIRSLESSNKAILFISNLIKFNLIYLIYLI